MDEDITIVINQDPEEISLGNIDWTLKIKSLLELSLEELNLTCKAQGIELLIGHLQSIPGTSKEEMVNSLCKLMMKAVENEYYSEAEMKCIINQAGPKLINMVENDFILKNNPSCSSSSPKELTDKDKEIVQYLAGAVLKWISGKRNIPNDMKWCNSHITDAISNPLPHFYEVRNRGSLLHTTEQFFHFIVAAEQSFRKNKSPTLVHENVIVEDLLSQMGNIFQQKVPSEKLTSEIVRRYIR